MSTTPDPQALLEQWRSTLLHATAPQPELVELGQVAEVSDGVATVVGLARALAEEQVIFSSGIQGQVMDLAPEQLGVMLLGPAHRLRPGDTVYRTGKVVSVPVGPALLGRTLNALGEAIDGGPPLEGVLRKPAEAPAPGILERTPVARPLASGIKAVDAAIPIGLGQRQLIIGDRQTGKTSLATDIMLNQRHSALVCIYCAVGQRGDAVARVIDALAKGGMRARSIVLNAGDEEAAGLAYLAPYSAMTMAEQFASQGQDVLLVVDDMTHHARAYRELSLLLRRPPGREAFPGDIFYVHARLLERAGQFGSERNHGSITVLPIVETEAENLSAYIPTNLISITDGQIYLSPRQVRKNQFPAVDLGLSVSRVGGKAQNRSIKAVAANLRVTLSQFEELEEFARFGTRLDAGVRERLVRGQAVRLALRQAERDPMTALEQMTVLLAAMDGLFDGLDDTIIRQAEARLRKHAVTSLPEIADALSQNRALEPQDQAEITALARRILADAAKIP